MKPLSKFILICSLFLLLPARAPQVSAASSVTFWQYQCIDTMKDSRDNARAWSGRADLIQQVKEQISAIKNMGANCVSLGTPYDDEFGTYMKVWVDEIHKQGLKVWFRGNVSGWEGWFGYPVLKNVSEHHQKINHFILTHPSFFKDGDIFTPAPEPEAGKIIGDPRHSESQKTSFLNFLVNSYNNCLEAFSLIDVKVVCGYFSTNGDIAKHVLTPEIVAKIGNVVVVDHYVPDPQVLVEDLLALHDKFQTKIMLGEFGAPIPDLHGKMTQDQQAAYIDAVFKGLAEHKDFLVGVNYWVLSDGSSALFNSGLIPRKAVDVVKNYYIPAVVKGTVSSTTGKKISGAKVRLGNGQHQAITDENGQFSLAMPAGQAQLNVEEDSYKPQAEEVTATAGQQISQNITLEPENLGWIAKMWNFVKGLFN